MVGDGERREGHHGIKRRASDELEREQRLEKRFNLLNLENDAKLYVPISSDDKCSHQKQSPDASNNELMEVEDTKHKVYIYDLDKELAESESDDERPIFIPDIEKHLLARIPRSVLIGDDARQAAKNMQMILYSPPTSLTVPPDKDIVRRAIIESRQRARDKQAFTVPGAPEGFIPHPTNGTERERSISEAMEEEDPDAMDMD